MLKYVLIITFLHQLLSVHCLNSTCPDGYLRNANSCYVFLHVELSWPDAVSFCKAVGSHLVRVETQAEHDFLKTKAKEVAATYRLRSFWTAATDAAVSGEWVWADVLTRLVYAKWAKGEPLNRPGEDCAGLYYQGGYDLGDFYCRTHLHPLCEINLTDPDEAEMVIG